MLTSLAYYMYLTLQLILSSFLLSVEPEYSTVNVIVGRGAQPSFLYSRATQPVQMFQLIRVYVCSKNALTLLFILTFHIQFFPKYKPVLSPLSNVTTILDFSKTCLAFSTYMGFLENNDGNSQVCLYKPTPREEEPSHCFKGRERGRERCIFY